MRESPTPPPETLLAELGPFFAVFPQYRAAGARRGARCRTLVAEEGRRAERGANGPPVAHADTACGRVPHRPRAPSTGRQAWGPATGSGGPGSGSRGVRGSRGGVGRAT